MVKMVWRWRGRGLLLPFPNPGPWTGAAPRFNRRICLNKSWRDSRPGPNKEGSSRNQFSRILTGWSRLLRVLGTCRILKEIVKYKRKISTNMEKPFGAIKKNTPARVGAYHGCRLIPLWSYSDHSLKAEKRLHCSRFGLAMDHPRPAPI